MQSLAKVSVGRCLQSGQPFITLVPSGAELEVETNIPGSEAGFAHDGDPVAIKFDTFPFSQYGMAEGGVRTLSPSSFTVEEEMRNPTSKAPVVGSGEPYYRARVSLDKIGLHGTPPGFRIDAGHACHHRHQGRAKNHSELFPRKVLPIAREGLREPQG